VLRAAKVASQLQPTTTTRFRARSGQSQLEVVRKQIVILIFIVYWLLIFEGVLRKWVMPSMQILLYFIRDPFVFATYCLAIKHKLWPRWSTIFAAGAALGAVFLILAMVQSLTSQVNPIILLYGWRNYFFYLPFAFIIGKHFHGKDLARLIRHTLIVSIPIAILCYEQFRAPADSALNASYSPTAQALLVSQGIVRTSGTFTVSAAQTLYIGSILAMLFAIWLLTRSQRPIKLPWLILASIAGLATFAVSGARSVFIWGAIIALFAFASAFIVQRPKPSVRRPKTNLKKFIVVPALLVIGGVCYVKFFPTAFSAIVQRQMEAQVNEGSTFLRALGSVTSILRVWPQLSLLGAGIGAGTNAASMMTTGQMGMLLAEDETQRIILEAGVFGVFYIAYRF